MPWLLPTYSTWTTGTTLDTTAPRVIGTLHADGATNVPINTRVGATFSEAMDPLTITNVTLTLKHGSTPVLGTIAYSNVSAVFVPAGNLAPNTVYTLAITTGVEDLLGNALAVPYMLSWTTGTAPDTTAPTVGSTIPTDLATSVTPDSAITAVFSEMMRPVNGYQRYFQSEAGDSAGPRDGQLRWWYGDVCTIEKSRSPARPILPRSPPRSRTWRATLWQSVTCGSSLRASG